MSPIDKQRSLVENLANNFTLLETHISYVILTGDYAYKIKKPVNFGFLNFETLEDRKYYCHEELRLNRRLAPDLYLEVLPIFGDENNPSFQGQGEPIEYAVKMLQFDQENLLDKKLENNQLDINTMDEIAQQLADFHQKASVSLSNEEWGQPEVVLAPMEENFVQIRDFVKQESDLETLAQIETWTHQQYETLKDLLAHRKQQGFIKECHGDLHLGNIALLEHDKLAIFDGIEFNKPFRIIDVINDAAFLYMDLSDRGQFTFAARFINAYLEATGDYEGIALLGFYAVYRALVRAKIALFSMQHDNTAWERYLRYIKLAQHFVMKEKNPRILITVAPSGAGKSTLAQKLVDEHHMIRLRSDAERLRMFRPEERYSPEANKRTYAKLIELSEAVLKSGYMTIIDATFLKQSQRHLFHQLAVKLKCLFAILAIDCTPEKMAEFIKVRSQKADDISEADESIMQLHVIKQELLTEEEQMFCFTTQCGDLELPEDFYDWLK